MKDTIPNEKPTLQEFAIWMTGCGYDFSKHDYFVTNRHLLSDESKENIKEKYNELLYQVQNKYPNETRHETALRIITENQTPTDLSGKAHKHITKKVIK